MQIAKIIHSIAEIFEGCSTKHTEEDLYRKKQLIFYQVVLEKQISLRFAINTALISISTAFLALLPTVTDHLFTNGVPCILKPLFIGALICFVLLILICIAMYELDSMQLLRLNRDNNGENTNIEFIPSITSTLLTIQYILLGFGVILTAIIFYYGIFYV